MSSKLLKSIIFLTLISLASFLASCNKTEEAPLPDIYLRGNFNEWSTSLPFQKVEGDWYVQLKLNQGTYSFKVGDQNWSVINLGILPAATINLGDEVALSNFGQDLTINILEDETNLVFILHKSGEGAFSIKVIKGTIKVPE